MKRSSFADMECPIARALDLLGDAWLMLIVRDVLLGFRCFAELEERLGIVPTTLTRKLEQLVDAGLLERTLYSDRPPRHEYVATEKAAALVPILVALAVWSNEWLVGSGKERLVVVDRKTGSRLDPVLVDKKTRTQLVPGSVRLAPGPAASARLKKALASRALALGTGGTE
jgi:DNA-binding HxlR family transcriptional regulator